MRASHLSGPGIEPGNQGKGLGGKTILTFEQVSLAEGEEAQLLGSYGGLTWTATGLYNTTEPTDQYGYGPPSSGENIAFYGVDYAEGPVTIESEGRDFNAFGASFTSVATQTVTATAYDDGEVVGVLAFEVAAGETRHVDFIAEADQGRFASIDTLVFSAPDYFGFDDFTLIG